MSNDITLEIQDSYTVHGRGLVLIPKAFQFITPMGFSKPFSDNIVVTRPDGICENVDAQFLIEHFSLISESGGLYSRYSLIVLLPEMPEGNLPTGSEIRITESTLNQMKDLIKRS